MVSSGIRFKTKKPAGNRPSRLTQRRKAMRRHRDFLPRILVKIGVKVKIVIVRK
jgi:hypothetical protein